MTMTGKRAMLAGSMTLAMFLLPTGAMAQNCTNGSVDHKTAEILNTRITDDTLVLAHRGFWGKYNYNGFTPENSLASVSAANAYCMDGIEIDVKMSEDGVPYIMHDFNLGRTTDAYTQFRGGTMYNPFTNTGTNPKMSSVSAADLDKMSQLSPNRSASIGVKIPRISELFGFIRQRPWFTPIVFDIKTSDAVASVDRLAGDFFPAGKSKTILTTKVNATLFPYPSQFFAVSRNLNVIPVYSTNMLANINVDDSLLRWRRDVRTIEVNQKQANGLLAGHVAELRRNRIRVGVFQAIPDAGRGDSFFKNTGECCYTLRDLFFVYRKDGKEVGRDTADNRGSLSFLVENRYGLITTDDPVTAVRFLAARGLRAVHSKDYPRIP